MITKEEIRVAAKLLLYGEASFDAERIAFIQNLQTRDLCAVPGSGKTTALQAKILCLAKHQGKDFNEGILALSFTNSAVASLRAIISSLAPNVFKYPNYFGTVHSFLNRFVANAACQILYQTKMHICDDEKYEKELKLQIKSIREGYKLITYVERHHVDVSKLYIDYNSRNICKPDGNVLLKAETASDSYNIFYQAKTAVSRKGVFSYDDSLNLSHWALDNLPDVAKALRKRFKFVFVDEAQDLKAQFIQLLKKIFSEAEDSIIQFIGDPNQSIYLPVGQSWEPYNPLSLSVSHRVSVNVARAVNLLTTVRQDLICHSSQYDNKIPPHLIIYDINSSSRLEETFANLIIKYNLHLKKYANKGFYIIGWNVKPLPNSNDRNLIRMETLFPSRVITEKNSANFNMSNDFVNWLSQLLYTYSSEDYKEREGIKNPKDFLCHLKERNNTKWHLALFYISDALNKNDIIKFRRYMKRLVEVLKSYSIFDEQGSVAVLTNEIDSIKSFNTPTYAVCKIPLKFASVHASKGRTYAATMYIETAYRGFNDSHYLFPVLFSQDSQKSIKLNRSTIEAMRVAYVGFSRPIGLLCYAVCKNSLKDAEYICLEGWEIVDITKPK